MTRLPISFSRRPARGVAILMVLVMLALLSVLVVVTLSRVQFDARASRAEVGGVQAEWLARGALETVVADIRQEMLDHSESFEVQPDGTRLFEILEGSQMRPTRSLKDPSLLTEPAYRNLLKQSADGSGFSSLASKPSGTLVRASPISTGTPAKSGRRITPGRWRLPLLYDVPGANPLSDGQVPDWIYLELDGENPAAFTAAQKNDRVATRGGRRVPNPDYVVGRYAYQIYETSGLLDLNVAGHDPEQTPAGDIELKGALLYADLTKLPGVDSGSGRTVGDLPLWRNRLLDDWEVSARRLVATTGRLEGWLRPAMSGGDNDNLFLSRQDLLAFQRARPNVLAAEALPFVTHFSRAINAPSYRPAHDAVDIGGNTDIQFAYSSAARDGGRVNPDVPRIRVTTPFTRRDGSDAKVGEPLMHRRFPLSKIDLCADPGGHAASVAEWFGIVSAGTATWAYQHFVSDEGGAERIMTLEEVADEGREPNFFEVLNAGILSGSVASSDASNWFYRLRDYDESSARHVLRIGACLIDQWDADSDPTVILAPDDGSLIESSEQVALAGVENVPYVDLIGQEHIIRFDLAGFPEWPWISGFYKTQLWNPHREAVSAAPGEYRLVLQGDPRVRIGLAPDGSWWQTRAKYWVESPGYPSDEGNNYIEFKTPLPGAAHPWLDKPQQLMGSMISKAAEENTIPEGGTNASPFVGLHLGKVKTDDHPNLPVDGTKDPPQTWERWGHGQGHFRFNQPVTVRLEKKIDGDWVAYQWIPRIERHHGNVPWSGIPSSRGNPENTAKAGNPSLRISYGRPDPRSIRYGMGSTGGGGSPRCVDTTAYAAFLAIGHGHAVPNHVGGEASVNGHWFRLAANDPSASPKTYTHRDGVLRRGDVTAAQPFEFDGVPEDNDGRPHILNRPFVSLGEMGLVFRDEPFKSLDFVSANSGDSGLLELFSLSEAPVVAGVFQPAAASPEVLEAVLSGLGRSLSRSGETLTGAEMTSLAAAILSNPEIRDLSDLGRLELLPGADNHEHREAIVRALADVANTRTWNLLVDVVAQAGRLSRSADGLEDFVVAGERRYWFHLAIDRLTGEVVDSQLEPVDE